MVGHGFNQELPKSLNKTFDNVWIFHGNPTVDGNKNGGLGVWDNLKHGHGKGFSSDGKQNHLSSRFGVELSFAKKMQELYPNQKIAIIKYSMGGTSIDSSAARNKGSWDPDFKETSNQFDYFLKTVDLAYNTANSLNANKTVILVPKGIIWMQGESDALFQKSAKKYLKNLKKLLSLIRVTFRSKNLPLIIGKISDSGIQKGSRTLKYSDIVQLAQEKYVFSDKNTSIIRSTKNYKYLDKYHYDSLGYLNLGMLFAIEIYKLENIKKKY
jgi:hypothetical protein